jgi:uncharacterized protein YehS (DUF1456 family)
MLRDDQIVEILELVDFKLLNQSWVLFRDEKHENYMECGDQVLRNFLNALVFIYEEQKKIKSPLTS